MTILSFSYATVSWRPLRTKMAFLPQKITRDLFNIVGFLGSRHVAKLTIREGKVLWNEWNRSG